MEYQGHYHRENTGRPIWATKPVPKYAMYPPDLSGILGP